MLGRLKTNYQLSELVKLLGSAAVAWIEEHPACSNMIYWQLLFIYAAARVLSNVAEWHTSVLQAVTAASLNIPHENC